MHDACSWCTLLVFCYGGLRSARLVCSSGPHHTALEGVSASNAWKPATALQQLTHSCSARNNVHGDGLNAITFTICPGAPSTSTPYTLPAPPDSNNSSPATDQSDQLVVSVVDRACICAIEQQLVDTSSTICCCQTAAGYRRWRAATDANPCNGVATHSPAAQR